MVAEFALVVVMALLAGVFAEIVHEAILGLFPRGGHF